MSAGRLLKFAEFAKSIRKDGWINALTGLGLKEKDKRLGAYAQWDVPIQSDLEHLYAADDMARKKVDTLPEDALREGIEFSSTEPGHEAYIAAIAEFVKNFYVIERVQLAWKWASLYGGSGIFLATDDGKKLVEPLDYANPGNLRSITVFHRFELTYSEIEGNLTNPNFGLPRLYRISPHNAAPSTPAVGQTEVHWSRIVRFDGLDLPRQLFMSNAYWGDSVLTKLLNPLRNFNTAHDSAAAMMQDFRTNVIRLKDLASLLQETTGVDMLQKRIEIMNLTKSVISAIVLDADEETFENITTNLTNVPEMLDKINQRLSGAMDMPHTLVFGNSPTGGLSGKGESEARDWYDQVQRRRENYLRPRLDQLFSVILSAKNGPTKGQPLPGFTYTFPPLWQMDDKELAEVRKTQAEADEKYLMSGVVSPTEVRQSRFGGEQFSLETKLIKGEEPELPEPQPTEET